MLRAGDGGQPPWLNPSRRIFAIRIIRAVEDEGMSCRGAAARFGVAPSTAIELVSDWRSTGACEARVQGGDRRSARIERHAAEILALVEATPDMTLAEIADHLFKAHGERFVPSVVWRFFDRRNITFKKNIARQRAGSAGRGRGTRGVEGIFSLRSTSNGWCSSTRPEPRPRWRGSMAVRLTASAVSQHSRMAIGRRRPSSARSGRPA